MSDLKIIEITGIQEMIAAIDKVEAERKEKFRRALDFVLIQMANYIKENGQWEDQTGNLRNSVNIAGSVEAVPQIKGSNKKLSLPALRNAGASWKDDKTLVGIIYAGMEYALYVEFKEGRWVISGAFAEYQDKIMDMIVDYVNQQE